MKIRKKIFNIKAIIILILLLALSTGINKQSFAASSIKLIVDGKDITSKSAPIVKNNRTLVPVRFISEELGAKVTWIAEDGVVKIEKDNRTILLKLDSRLVQYIDEKENYFLSDVAPIAMNGRTYAPLRLVSNALGIGIQWDGANNAVKVDSNIKSIFTPFFQEKISTINSGQAINGKMELQIQAPNGTPKNGVEIKYLLLDPKTAKGRVVASG